VKKHFITGLMILLPLAVTLAVISFLFNLLTKPFAGVIAQILSHYNILNQDYLFATAREIQYFISQVLILVFLFLFTVLLGYIARYFLVNYLLRLWDYLLHRIPLIRSIYKASKDVINTLFTSQTKSFKQVVLVPFPNKGSQAIGFITQDELGILGKNQEEQVAVFVPATPNPTSGFLMVYPRSEIVYLDMKVEEAFKYVISCGVLLTSLNPITYEQSQLKKSD
jgi:uncharacterized membrane protein